MKSSAWTTWKSSATAMVTFLCLVAAGRAGAQLIIDREPVGPSSRRTGLVITEIMYHPLTNAARPTESLEFIELYNSKPWAENIGGYSITGSVSYTFAPGTMLPAYSYLVIARQPDNVRSNYSIENVVGPWANAGTRRLPLSGGTVQLRNRQNAVLLSVDYEDSPPWSVSADGKGHSLVLARPSYGENDVRAWAQSDKVGGSPGYPDANNYEPLRDIVINEYMCHTDIPFRDAIELYNHSEVTVDLSGAYLTDSGDTNKFRIPDGTLIAPHGFVYFDDSVLGFQLFAGGETIFLLNPSQTRAIDSVEFKGQSNNWSSGRSPDGGPFHYGLSTPTLGAPNAAPMRYDMIINELMYNPITGDTNDEYIELHNRGTGPANIAGWTFQSGVAFTFPTNSATVIPAGGYLVVAKSPTNLFAIYAHLNSNNTVGPYSGTLANSGERVALAAADYVNIVSNGVAIPNVKIAIIVSEVTYDDGGRWPEWADGEGTSLELIDLEADPRFSANWADSDTTGSMWTAVEYNGPLGEPLGSATNDSIIIMLEGVGECLVDEVEVRADNGPNLVANGGFESGLGGWTLQGSHDFSTIESAGFEGSRSLHVRSGSRGDNQSNRILSSPFTIPPGTRRVSIRAKGKWIRGNPELLLRLHGSATEANGRLQVPRRFGTPGLANSRRIANAGPAISEVKHAPLLPVATEQVIVTARASDRHGLAALTLRFRVDPSTNYTNVVMRDDGAAPDTVIGDGIFTARIPGQASNRIVAFYLEARDGLGATSTFPKDVFPPAGMTRCWPNDGLTRECLVRWGERQMPGDFATYHLLLTHANSNRWAQRDPMNNTEMDGTFIYNNTRLIYNALPLYSGSPWHRTNSTTGPAGTNRVDYEMNFPPDNMLLGARNFILNNSGNPDILTISDLSAVNEQTVYAIFEAMNLPHNHRRYFHFFVNGSQRSTTPQRQGNFIFEDSQQPNGEMQMQWFPEDAAGSLYKVEDWFEFERNGFDVAAYDDADLIRRTTLLDGQEQLAGPAYRYKFRKRSADPGELAADLSPIFDLVDMVSPPENPNSATVDPRCFGAVADWEQWMRTFAVQHALGNFDTYSWIRGKNLYMYKPVFSGIQVMPWDIDYGLGMGRPANAPLFESNDPRVLAMWNTPEIARAYWRAFDEMTRGPFSNAYLDPFIDTRVSVLLSNTVNVDLSAVASIKDFISQRRSFLLSQLGTVAAPFAIEGPGFVTTANELHFIRGTAPVEARYITFNDVIYPVTWTSVTGFTMRVVLQPGLNRIAIGAANLRGASLPGLSQTITVEYTGDAIDPVGVLVINEIMHSPARPGAQFIEILNRSNRAFDLWGWRLDGIGKVFGPGTIITNGQVAVLVRNIVQFKRAHPGVPFLDTFDFDLSGQEQILRLVKTLPQESVVDILRYEGVAPWPNATNGVSIQLIDSAQDNTRPSNWAADALARATPGALNSVAGTLPPYDLLWLNEIQIESLNGPLDNFSEREPWIELFNSGPGTLVLDGYYLANRYESNLLLQWRFPAGATIAPNERKLVWLDGETNETALNAPHTSFRSEQSGKLALVRVVNQQPQITDYLTWERLPVNLSYGDFPEGQIVFRARFPDTTPGQPNIRRALNLLINEWLAANTAGAPNPATGLPDDWFELYNAEFFPIELSGFYVTDDLNNRTKSRFPLNQSYVIPAGGFMLVWADDISSANGSSQPEFHAAFRLAAGGESIGLFFPDGGPTAVDAVTFGAQTANVSEGRFGDGATTRFFMTRPTPRAPNSITSYNSAPRFPSIANRLVGAGTTVSVPVTATDPDGHAINYSLDAAPPGSTVLAGGTFRWAVPTNQPWGDYTVTVRATDNGSPPRSATATFIVTVGSPYGPPPLLYDVASTNGMATFTFNANVGRTYRVFYSDDLTTRVWTQLDRDFVAANPSVSITDHVPAPRRFYRVLLAE